MKKNLKSAVVVFLVAMLVMQVVFNGSNKVGAAHSDVGSIQHVQGIRVVVEAGTNKVSPCYCISRNLYCSNNDAVTSNMQLDANKSFLLNTAFLYGYNVNTTLEQIPAGASVQWGETQRVVWAIMEDKFDGTVNTIQNCTDCDSEMLKKIAFLNTTPSYINGQENELKWNESTGKFELVLTNTTIDGTYSANASVQVDTTSLPAGVTATVEGENIKLESTEEFTEVKTIKLYKRAAEKGLVVAWDNGGGTRQPQITLDYDEDPIAKVMDLNIKTDKKPVVEVAPTPEPTVEPTVDPVQPTEQPTAVEPVQENQTCEVKENNLNETPLDDVPQTADETDLTLPLQLAAASGITMMWLAVAYLIRKKRETI